MITNQSVGQLLNSMSSNKGENVSKIIREFNRYNVKSADTLFVLTDERYDERACLLAIESLLDFGHCSINAKDSFNYNFIQNAIYECYSSVNKFIC